MCKLSLWIIPLFVIGILTIILAWIYLLYKTKESRNGYIQTINNADPNH